MASEGDEFELKPRVGDTPPARPLLRPELHPPSPGPAASAAAPELPAEPKARYRRPYNFAEHQDAGGPSTHRTLVMLGLDGFLFLASVALLAGAYVNARRFYPGLPGFLAMPADLIAAGLTFVWVFNEDEIGPLMRYATLLLAGAALAAAVAAAVLGLPRAA